MLDSTFKLMLRRLGLVFLLYSFLRAVFFISNYSSFGDTTAGDVALAFVHGFRFDIAALFIINSLFILLSILPHGNIEHKVYQRVLLWLFIVCNAPFIALSLTDVEFFKFIGRRSGNEVLTMTGDIINQLGQLARYYWYMGLSFALILATIVYLYPKSSETNRQVAPVWLCYVRLGLIVCVVVFGIRGGFQLKPLRPAHAFVQEQAILGHLSLNTPFNFIKSIGKDKLEQKNYFATDEALFAALAFTPDKYTRTDGQPLKENVVILILESFASEYVGALNNGQGYTPFLDSLASEGLLFRNNFANGRKSIDGIPSILSGLPSLLPEPFITSPFLSNTVYSAGHLLRDVGYTTAFFHGADNGTMGFSQFTELAGIELYYGLDEYPSELREQDYDGNWGIFDEPYLQYVAKEINSFQQPFFSTVFTLSSHHPYTVPDKYKGRFPKGELEIHESVGYADHALRQFFKTAKKQSWYNNTLFVLVADHTQKSTRPEAQKEPDFYRVPLVLYHPGKKLEADVNKITQHVDILPTLADYLELPTDKLLPFGQSVLDKSAPGQAVFYNGASYFLVQKQGITELTTNDQARSYSFPDMAPKASTADKTNQLKAYVQFFRNKMVANDLYFWHKKKQPGVIGL